MLLDADEDVAHRGYVASQWAAEPCDAGSGRVTWSALFGAFVLSHLAGDFLLQTDWQAMHKQGGLGRDVAARRALGSSTSPPSAAAAQAFAGAQSLITNRRSRR
jgi:hypothetical protein